MISSSNEDEIIRAVIEGNTKAYADIVRNYQSKVLGLCYSLLGNMTQAEDAAQDIFFKAYRSLASFRKAASFSTWLYRIASNHCTDLLRQRARQKTESLEALTETMGDFVENIIERAPSVGVSAEAAERMERILSSLSLDERLILTLREAEGLSYEEISDTLQCSVEAVRSRLRRARESLQEKLRHFMKVGHV